jgi:hypothetical protein
MVPVRNGLKHFFLAALGVEFIALSLLGRYSATWAKKFSLCLLNVNSLVTLVNVF